MTRYPFLPLYRRLGSPSLLQLARRTGCHPRQVYRWRNDGLSELHADRAACHAGLHPSTIWPEWFEDGDDDDRYWLTDEGAEVLHREAVLA